MSHKVVVHTNVYAVIGQCFHVSVSAVQEHVAVKNDWQRFNHLDQHLVKFVMKSACPEENLLVILLKPLRSS